MLDNIENCCHPAGDDFLKVLTYSTDGTVEDVTDWEVTFTGKKNKLDTNLIWEVDGVILVAEDGTIKIEMSNVDTLAIDPGTYFYLIQAKRADGTIFSNIRGSFTWTRKVSQIS